MRAVLAVMAASVLLAGCSSTDSPSSPSSDASAAASAPAAEPPTGTSPDAPSLTVETVAQGMSNPWDLAFLPDGRVLLTERNGALSLLSSTRPGAARTAVRTDFADLNPRGEGGLMGLLLMPDFATSREFVTCETHRTDDIRLVVRTLSPDGRSAVRTRDLLTGIPVARSGRHSGCRMAFGPDRMMYIGTGDTANPVVPQDRTSLGGKVLRIDPRTGDAPSDNPFVASGNPHERLVWTYGHRNVQGIAVHGAQVYAAEHGPDRNDEVNLLASGRNYGWDPSSGGQERSDYDESVPMTDTERYPDAVPAIWRSGEMTEAICAATFVTGERWRGWNGALMVTALKGSKLLVLHLDDAGTTVSSTEIPKAVDDSYGRLRAARQGPDGALYVTTSNGHDDKLLRITPG